MSKQEKLDLFKNARHEARAYWTQERIQILIEDLQNWVLDENSVCMSGFRGYNCLTKDVMEYVRGVSPLFKRCYEAAALICANRLALKTGKKIHSTVANMLIPVYDDEVGDFQKQLRQVNFNASGMTLDQFKTYQETFSDKSN